MEKYSQSYCPFNLIYLFNKPNMFGMLYFQKTSSTVFSVKMLTVQWKQIDVNVKPINTVIFLLKAYHTFNFMLKKAHYLN